VLLKPLPFADPSRLLTLQEQTEQVTEYGNLWAFAYPNFLDLQSASQTLEVAAWRYRGGTVGGPGEPEYVSGREISPSLFSVLGLSLRQGRTFLPAEDRPGASPVVILGYELWQRQFGADPSAIGRSLVFEGAPYTGCGNTVNVDHPRVRELVLSSLRYWAGDMGVDGFRFDLATILGRHDSGFNFQHPLLQAIENDKFIAGLKLIAEPRRGSSSSSPATRSSSGW
jgi:hypothetical protein